MMLMSMWVKVFGLVPMVSGVARTYPMEKRRGGSVVVSRLEIDLELADIAGNINIYITDPKDIYLLPKDCSSVRQFRS